jgi:hypothetical protein
MKTIKIPGSLLGTILAGLLAASPAVVFADIYRCIAPDGGTLYSDSPCPREAVRKSNITNDVGACNDAKCEAQRRAQADEARERLRAEKQELSEMALQRREANIQLERERLQLEALRYQHEIDERLAGMANQSQEAAPPETYPVYPGYPGVVVPCGAHCGKAHRPPHRRNHTKPRSDEPSVRLRVDR